MKKEVMAGVAQLEQFDEELYKVMLKTMPYILFSILYTFCVYFYE